MNRVSTNGMNTPSFAGCIGMAMPGLAPYDGRDAIYRV